ncbi:hypothetical protein [Kitasatospora sp. NPDC093102]|uniref:hypothetical protein n=1 Tax=Kitasatospora sp. NPDC093102 TaxID=3155069 RepID=UPI00343D15C4
MATPSALESPPEAESARPAAPAQPSAPATPDRPSGPATPSAPSAPEKPWTPYRMPGPARLTLWTAAALAGGLGGYHGGPVGYAAAGAGAAVLGATAVLWPHRSIDRVLSRTAAYRKERLARFAGEDEPATPEEALRGSLLPDLEIFTGGPTTDRIGVVYDGTGWAAAISVQLTDYGTPELLTAELAPLLRDPLGDLASLQVLVHSSPGGEPGLVDGCPTSPILRQTLIVLRVEARGRRADGPFTTAALAVRALRKRLRTTGALLARHGITCHRLDAEELTFVLRLALGAELVAVESDPETGAPLPPPVAMPDRTVETDWSTWQFSGIRHEVLRVRKAEPGALAALHEQASPTRTAVTSSVTLFPTGGAGVAQQTLVRISRRDGDDEAARASAGLTNRFGLKLASLNGVQGDANLAVLPLARRTGGRGSWEGAAVNGDGHDPRTTQSVDTGGLLIGYGRTGDEIGVRLLGSTGRSTALVTPPQIARLLALRAAKSGAQVLVVSHRPDLWQRLRTTAPFSVRIAAPGATPSADDFRPWLVLEDVNHHTALPRPERIGPLRGSLTLLPPVGTEDTPWATSFDTVVVASLPQPLAERLGQAFDLTPKDVAELPTLPSDTLAVIRRRSVRYATFQGAGPLEQTVLL